MFAGRKTPENTTSVNKSAAGPECAGQLFDRTQFHSTNFETGA